MASWSFVESEVSDVAGLERAVESSSLNFDIDTEEAGREERK
jgi:hypothetical protein